MDRGRQMAKGSTQPHTHSRWRRRRLQHLRAEPLCRWCLKRGLIVPATIVHHAEKHDYDRLKFWHTPLVSLCKRCHDSDAQSIEKGGKPKRVIGPDGWPIDG